MSSREPVNLRSAGLLPRKAAGVEVSGLRLTVTMQSRTWARRILRLPETTTRTFELDERGKRVFEACDGETSIEQIVEKLAGEYQLKRDELEAATLKFLDMMLRRGLITIEAIKSTDRESA